MSVKFSLSQGGKNIGDSVQENCAGRASGRSGRK
jgi:hypothetical protein